LTALIVLITFKRI